MIFHIVRPAMQCAGVVRQSKVREKEWKGEKKRGRCRMQDKSRRIPTADMRAAEAIKQWQWAISTAFAREFGMGPVVGSGVLKQGRKQQKKVGLDFGMDQV